MINKHSTLSVATFDSTGEIHWHVEQRGRGPDVVLVPSGEGDCGSFERVAANLAEDFRVMTFDTPGFSRSGVTREVAISMVALTQQIATLSAALGIESAAFYGSSSGGLAILDLVSTNPGLVRRAIVHEVSLPRGPWEDNPVFAAWRTMDEKDVSAACADWFHNVLNEDPNAWSAVGEAFHARLRPNFVTWARKYVFGGQHGSIDQASLVGRPIAWTIGGMTEARQFFNNVRVAHLAGIELELMPCRHFPQISIPDYLAQHIRDVSS